MARTTASQAKDSTKKLAIGFANSATTIWVVCAKRTSQVAKKLRPQPNLILTAFTTKVTCFGSKKMTKTVDEESVVDDINDKEYGLWQKSIIMGDKCEPLDFSGVICYDSNGKKLDEIPAKSPKASPLPPGYHFNSAMAMRDNKF